MRAALEDGGQEGKKETRMTVTDVRRDRALAGASTTSVVMSSPPRVEVRADMADCSSHGVTRRKATRRERPEAERESEEPST